MEDAVAAKMLIQGFLSGLQICFFLVFIVVTIIDMRRTKQDWKATDNWIKNIENQMKFEKQMLDMIVKQDARIDKIEEHLGIKEEENE
jgi:sensor domain CHASE-containing protein